MLAKSFFSVVVMFCFCVIAQAQTTKDAVEVKRADVSTVREHINSLYGNVVLSAGGLHILSADSVTINQVTNKLTCTGYCKFRFNGQVVVNKSGAGNRIEYIVGDDKLYLHQ